MGARGGNGKDNVQEPMRSGVIGQVRDWRVSFTRSIRAKEANEPISRGDSGRDNVQGVSERLYAGA